MNITKLAAWVRRRPAETKTYVLSYITVSDTTEQISIWPVAELDNETDETISEVILRVAQDDCDEREIVSRYALCCLDSSDKILKSQIIKCYPETPKKNADPLDIGAVAANNGMSQMVRMNEITMRLFANSHVTILNGYKVLIESLQEEIRALRARDRAASEILNLAAQIETTDDKKSEALDKLVSFAEKVVPVILGNINEGEGPPAV